MKRRLFLQGAAAAGLALMLPGSERKARADSKTYGGPYYVFLNAGGGWDPTSLCDPKGGKAGDRTTVNQSFDPSAIGSAGAIKYAPLSLTITGKSGPVEVYSNKRFFDDHGPAFTVLNGVDTTTNNHDSGSRTTFCGQTQEGCPSLAALIAGVMNDRSGQSLPMPFLSYGGYDATFGVAPLTRAGSVGSLQRLAYPNRMDASKADSPTFHTTETMARIRAAQQDRVSAMQSQTLPYTQAAMSALFMARGSDAGLSRLADALSATKLIDTHDVPDLASVGDQLGDLTGLMQQAQIALTAFQTGVAVTANLSVGGFDTHSNHDYAQTRALMVLLRGLDYLLTQAKAMGLSDKIVIVVGSDFGRTPYYNSGNGKDHWNITSMLFSGPGITGGRVVGATDEGFKPLNVNPTSLAVDPSGVRVLTSSIHLALRRYAKIDGEALVQRFPLKGDALPLFG